MRAFFLCILTIAVSAEEPGVKELPHLKVGTNSYNHVTVRKRNAAEAIVKFDGGVTMVKIVDLPEPIRSEWYDEKEVAELAMHKEADLAEFRKLQHDAQQRAVPVETAITLKISQIQKEITSLETQRSKLVATETILYNKGDKQANNKVGPAIRQVNTSIGNLKREIETLQAQLKVYQIDTGKIVDTKKRKR
jgi:hypothetical protein